MTVAELRKALRGVDARAVVHVCIPDFPYVPVVEATVEGEDDIGIFLLLLDENHEALRE